MEVWGFLTDRRTWDVKLIGFEPVLANQFVIKHYPILGTCYTGVSKCKVTAVAPRELLEFSMGVIAVSAQPTTWILRFEIDAYFGGSRVAINIFGADPSDRDQRVGLYVTRSFLDAQLSRLCRKVQFGEKLTARVVRGKWSARDGRIWRTGSARCRP